MTKLRKMLASVMLAGAIVTPFAVAQDNSEGNSEQPRGERGERGEDRGNRGSFDPAQIRERMVERLKEQLAPADDAEWEVIKPRLEKAMTVRFEQMMGNFGGGFGRGRGGPGGGGEEREPRNDTERASRDLSKTLEDKSASADTIAAKLTALREARAKAAADVKATQEDLRGVLSARQEAVLVVNGMLE